MFTVDGRIYGRRISSLKYGVGTPSGCSATPIQREEDDLGVIGHTYGNRLLSLRAALSEKELQLVELREQHIIVVNRAATARRNWEDAIKSKDRVILELRRALHVQKCEFDRQERVNEENVQRLFHERDAEENEEIVQKQRGISLLEQKNAHFVEELVEQQKIIAQLQRQLEARERQFASYLHKMDAVNVRVQDMNAELQKKDDIIESQKMHCQELKGLVWKRDAMIGQLQLAEQQLQSALAKQEAEHEALKCLKEKFLGEKILAEKNLAQLKESYEHLDSGAFHKECEWRLQEKEESIWTQRQQILDLQKALQSKEIALNNKWKDKHQHFDEAMRVVHRYGSLRKEFEHSQRKQQQLEMDLETVQERLLAAEMVVEAAEQSSVVKFIQTADSSEVSVSEDQVNENQGDGCDSERKTSPRLRDTAIRMASAAKSISNRCKVRQSRSSDTARLHCPSFSAARDKSSVTRQSESRVELCSPVSVSNPNSCLSTAKCEMQVPIGTPGYELGQTSECIYPSTPEATKQADGERWAVASTTETHACQSGIDGDVGKMGVSRNEAKLLFSCGSSQLSSSSTDVDSSFDNEHKKGRERRPNQSEGFSFASRVKKGKKHLNSTIFSKYRADSQRKPHSEQPIYNHKINSLLETNNSATSYKTSMRGDLESPRAARPVKFFPSTKQFQDVKKVKSPICNGKFEVSKNSSAKAVGDGRLFAGQVSRPVANHCQENGLNVNDLTKTEFGSPQNFHNSEKKLPRELVHRQARQSLKSLAPTLMCFDGSGDATFISLQEEVVKRERGWRKTEANIRAALCQRLNELKEVEKSSLQAWD